MVASVQPFQSLPAEHALAVFRLLDQMPRRTHGAIRRGLYDIGGEATSYLERRLATGPRSGRTYRLSGEIRRRARKALHKASAAGEFPAKLTGDLANSTDYRVRAARELEVGVGMPYGPHLEFGTRYMDRRPLIEPTSNQFAQQFALLLVRYSRVALDRGRATRFAR